MRIQDFNAKPEEPALHAPPTVGHEAKTASGPDWQTTNVVPLQRDVSPPDGRAEAELALLRARIEHLELVVETARGLMTANQERLLRRLHDMPREVASLTWQLGRVSGTPDSSLPGWGATETTRRGQA